MIDVSIMPVMQGIELVVRSHRIGSARYYPLAGRARRGRRPYM